jgi:hypothetical protein
MHMAVSGDEMGMQIFTHVSFPVIAGLKRKGPKNFLVII